MGELPVGAVTVDLPSGASPALTPTAVLWDIDGTLPVLRRRGRPGVPGRGRTRRRPPPGGAWAGPRRPHRPGDRRGAAPVDRRGRATGAGGAGPAAGDRGFLGRRTPSERCGPTGCRGRAGPARVPPASGRRSSPGTSRSLRCSNCMPRIWSRRSTRTLGGFGDSGTTRVEVASSALDRLSLAGWPRSLDTCWIVGDTPRDLQCARALGRPLRVGCHRPALAEFDGRPGRGCSAAVVGRCR